MIRRAVEKRRQSRILKYITLKGTLCLKINMYIKELENYKKSFQTISQVGDSDVWKKVNISTMKTLVKFRRRKEDGKGPTSKVELQRRWNKALNRSNMKMSERLVIKGQTMGETWNDLYK